MRKLPRLVQVEWVDSCGLDGWTGQKSLDALTATSITSVGFVFGDTKDCLTIGSHCARDEDTSPTHAPIAIPKRAIRTIRTIRRK